jgi:hypothetical protein
MSRTGKVIEGKQPCHDLRFYLGICQEELRKISKLSRIFGLNGGILTQDVSNVRGGGALRSLSRRYPESLKCNTSIVSVSVKEHKAHEWCRRD